MPTSNSPRKYNLSDAELCMFTSNLCTTMTRDLDDLSFFGINQDKIDDLKSLGDEFEVFQPDDSYIGDVMIATQDKIAKMEIVKETIRNMAMRVSMKWGENSGQYRKLGITGMNNFNEDKLLAQSRSVHGNISLWLDDLESTGLTQDMLDDFENANEAFEVAKDAQNTAMNTRDNMTELRITKGNELYNLVSTYCEIGKRVFATKSPAKYNDYLIYGTGSGGSSGGGTNPNAPSAPSNFRYDYGEVAIRWSAVSGATSYQVEFSEDNTNWEVIYDGPDTEFITNPMLAEHTYLRARARNAGGFSAYTSTVNIVYDLTLPMAQNLTYLPAYPGFNWNVVPGAINYEVHLRNQSAPPDEWLRIYFGNDNTLYHADPIGSYVYRIRAWNNQGTSAWAELEYSVTP